MQCFGVAQLAVAALLPDQTFCISTTKKIIVSDKFLVVDKMFDPAAILQLTTAPPENTAFKT